MSARTPATMASGTAVVRRAVDADRGDLARFFGALSPLSSFQRFFGGGFRATEPMLDVLLQRGLPGGAQVAIGPDGIVGHAMWTSTRSGRAEIAFAVADDRQGRGIGTRLVRAVVADAVRHGAQEIEIWVLEDNEAAHRLVRRQWPHACRLSTAGEVEYRVVLRPGPQIL